MVRFGIVGCGAISAVYVEAIAKLDRAVLTGVYDINTEKGTAFARQFGIVYYPALEKLLSSDVDAVCICTPSGLHASIAIQAANAGKNIVVEKPLGITAGQLDAIADACEKNKIRLCAISQMYFSDAFRKLKKAVDDGSFGRVFLADLSMKYFRSDEYYASGGWRGTWAMDGGGALMNQGIHGVGLLLELLGPVKSVTALTRTFAHPIEVEDTAVAILEFKSGVLGSIVATTSVTPGKPRIMSIHGTGGTAVLTEDTITEWSIKGEDSVVTKDHQIQTSASSPSNLSSELHCRQLKDFIDSIEKGKKPVLSISEGRMPVDLILAIYRSSKTGKTVSF
jgi:UDP-N-acetyl-2-amino-2-deoxyglucuronate dehydrogenase